MIIQHANLTTFTMYVYRLDETVWIQTLFEPQHEISINVVCATSKVSDQPAHMCSLIRAFASRLNIL